MTKSRQNVLAHPGTILRAEYLDHLGIRPGQIANTIRVSKGRIDNLLAERRPVNADMSIRLGRYFGKPSDFWINLQYAHDLSKAEAGTDYSKITPRAA